MEFMRPDIINLTSVRSRQYRLNDILRQGPVADRLRGMANLSLKSREGGVVLYGSLDLSLKGQMQRRITVPPLVKGNITYLPAKDLMRYFYMSENEHLQTFQLALIHSHPFISGAVSRFSIGDFKAMFPFKSFGNEAMYRTLGMLHFFKTFDASDKKFVHLSLLQATKKADKEMVRENLSQTQLLRGSAEQLREKFKAIFSKMGFRYAAFFGEYRPDEPMLGLPLDDPEVNAQLKHFRAWPKAAEEDQVMAEKGEFAIFNSRDEKFLEDYMPEARELMGKIANGGAYTCDDIIIEPLVKDMLLADMAQKGLFRLNEAIQAIGLRGNAANRLYRSILEAAGAGKLSWQFTVKINEDELQFWDTNEEPFPSFAKAADLLFEDEIKEREQNERLLNGMNIFGQTKSGPLSPAMTVMGPMGETYRFFDPNTLQAAAQQEEKIRLNFFKQLGRAQVRLDKKKGR